MKKYLLIALILGSIAACKNPSKEESINLPSRDSLMAVSTERITTGTGFMASFAEIRKNLDTIHLMQKYIRRKTNNPKFIKNEMITEINTEILSLNSVLEKNRESINKLNIKLKAAENRNKELEDSAKALNYLLSLRESELISLKNELNQLNDEFLEVQATMFFLFVQNALKDEILADEIETSQAAYYIVGTNKYLRDIHVIDNKGGLLGIGKTSVINGDAGKNSFTKVNYTRTTLIPVNSKTMKIISSHPASAYTIIKENNKIKSLNITDPEEFWHLTKYLVVEKGS